jgi:long-chain acyl-CoA synthetase
VPLREFIVPPLLAAEVDRNLTDTVAEHAAQRPRTVLFSRFVDGSWSDIDAERFLAEVTGLAKGLVAGGVGPGDRVGLMSKTRYEWTLADYAIWFAGAVTVPIYETSSAEQVQWILGDSGAVAVIVETPAHAATVAQVRDGLPGLKQVWTIDSGMLEELANAGAEVSDEEISARRSTLTSESLATIIYTSGTTGRPKGCELTHANLDVLTRNAVASLTAVVEAPGASTLLFLPLAHVFARFVQVLCVTAGARMGHTSDVKHLVQDLGRFKPTFVLAVPRVFEKIYNSAEASAAAGGKASIFAAAATTAIGYSEALDKGGPGLLQRGKHAVFDRLVYGKLRAAMGGQVQYAVSGGAPLSPRLGHFFRGIGVTILEGWGLTETTAPATVNTPDHLRIGTVGRPLPGVGIRVDDDGELLVNGVGVLGGYYHDEAATAEAIVDGWFRTGDLGEIDDDGYIRITGRKKEIIVTAAGKNVAPTVLEDRLRGNVLVSQCMVVGDQRPYVAVLVTLDAEMLPGWLKTKGKPDLTVEEARHDADVRAEVAAAVEVANQAVSHAEAIKKFEILAVDFTEAGGQLTPKLSLKRRVVMKECAEDVERLYQS